MADNRSQGRASVVAAERRRRGDSEMRANKRLPIPPEVEAQAKAKGLHLRWANDEGNRIWNLTNQDDYDVVEGVAPVPIGTGKDGQPIMARLLAKRKDFMEEDRAKREEARRSTEKSLLRGRIPAAGANAQPDGPSQFYADTANKIEGQGGNQILE